MRIVGGDALNTYAKRRPKKKESLRRLKEVEAQFTQVVVQTLPDRVTFDFPEEDLLIDMRVNCALGLVRIVSVGSSVTKKGDNRE
jgi:hypothetical protein